VVPAFIVQTTALRGEGPARRLTPVVETTRKFKSMSGGEHGFGGGSLSIFWRVVTAAINMIPKKAAATAPKASRRLNRRPRFTVAVV